ncbi:MAG: nucleotide exchange factor GrpE [Pseudolysinimonas sp.]
MASKQPKDENAAGKDPADKPEPKFTDKRRVDSDGETRAGSGADDLIEAEGPDVETGGENAAASDAPGLDLSDEDIALLAGAERDLVAEYRDRAARAEAELKNFRTRVERDRAANRELVIAEVLRTLLPAIDDLDRADAHGDLVDGSPLTLVAQKLRAGFERYGLIKIGAKGVPFDPKIHEAIVQVYSAEVTSPTVADVIEPGYAIGDRLLRPAKVAVSVPEP